MSLDNEETLSADYRRLSEDLLERIKLREEMVEILKLAKPDQLAAVHTCISRLDDSIEDRERLLEKLIEINSQKKLVEKQESEFKAVSELVEQELEKYLVENEPDKLELFEALMTDDGRSH